MNLRDLKYFIALAETRHFGQAAERSFVTQPTLSGQIKKLEEELGVTLFERTKKTVALTAIGEALLPYARRAVEEAVQTPPENLPREVFVYTDIDAEQMEHHFWQIYRDKFQR